mmetsp:Transcript_20843/g.66014  ORF Transcript_20843/g.66014 Transcript_20843/m.66014 type:complete len:351 (-) Transcript_20843:9-1061(-)
MAKGPAKKGPKKAQMETKTQLLAIQGAYAALTKMHGLKMYPPLKAAIDKGVDTMKPMEKVVVQDDTIGPMGVKCILDMLAGYAGVRNVCFWRSRIGDEGLGYVCDILRASATSDKWSLASKVRLLEVTNDDCDGTPGGGGFSIPAVERLGRTLALSGVMVKVLVLDHNRLGDAGVRALATGLEYCRALEHLSLAFNGVGPAGAAAVAELLVPSEDADLQARKPQLVGLSMQGNELGGEGVLALAKGIEVTKSLKILNLANVHLTNEHPVALKALTDALMANDSLLEKVDINFNPIGSEAAANFLPAVAKQVNLKVFRVTHRVERDVAESYRLLLFQRNTKKKGKGKKKKK